MNNVTNTNQKPGQEQPENIRPAHYPKGVERNTKFWKSFDEKNDTPEYRKAVETEFMSSPLREESKNEGGCELQQAINNSEVYCTTWQRRR